jgi:predicted 3-demethylubiquinone-9 3-methyltransferase (glyoxalase superfamily)
MSKIATFLTFQQDGAKAVEFYTSLIKNSSIDHIMKMPDSEQLLHAGFTLDGQEFMAMDGGDGFSFSEGTSIFINCEDQAEVDHYWEALIADGGAAGRCGWLKDRYRMSWQVIPKQLGQLMGDPDREKSGRVMQAMLSMNKLDVAELQAAYDGELE